jgi:hypothetical protein
MSWFVPSPTLAPGDRVLWHTGASREEPTSSRQVGGLLYLVTSQLIFQPNRFEGLLGNQTSRHNVGEITDVLIEPRSPAVPWAGRMAKYRRRLRVSVDDRAEISLVNNLDEVMDALRSFHPEWFSTGGATGPQLSAS